MTIDQAIHTVDELKPNQIEKARLIDFLDRLDRQIWRDVISTHWPDEDTPEDFFGYDQATEPDTVLLAKEPYDDLYRYYLEMQIDLINREYDSYNNTAALFAARFGDYKRDYHRAHRSRTDRGNLDFGDMTKRPWYGPLSK